MIKRVLFFFAFFLLIHSVNAQDHTIFIRGTVIDSATGAPMELVSVYQNSSKTGTLTDEYGNYTLELSQNGIIRFSYLGYKEYAVPLVLLSDDQNLNVRMTVLPFYTPELNITARKISKIDSLNNRKEYKSIFDARQSSSYMMMADLSSSGIGLSPSRFINNHLSAHNRNLRSYRKIIERKEKLTYISSRFTPQLVTGITGLKGAALTTFMNKNQPDYEALQKLSDYDLAIYIQGCFKKTRAPKPGATN